MQHIMTPQQRTALVAQLTTLLQPALAHLVDSLVPDQLETVVQDFTRTLATHVLPPLVQALAPRYPAPTQPCACGATATYQRQRPVQVRTLHGPVCYRRAYYVCATCHQGSAPLDAALGWCPGGLSAALRDRLALLGVTCPFAEAADLLDRLTGVQVSPTVVQQVTEAVGAQVLAQDPGAAAALANPLPPPHPTSPAAPLYISLDGAMVHLETEGWKEVRVGSVYTTQRAGHHLRAVAHSYVAILGEVETMARTLRHESERRGVEAAAPVVVIGDGAPWIWRVADDYWPGAVQIVDWYHATQHLWQTANALFGEGTPSAAAWEQAAETLLWAGDVNGVLDHLHAWAWRSAVVCQTETYFIRNRPRMQYATYRAQGLQIGSGGIESACKRVVQARCKRAGMRWSRTGVQAVLAARARYLSGRWEATVAMCPPPSRIRSAA